MGRNLTQRFIPGRRGTSWILGEGAKASDILRHPVPRGFLSSRKEKIEEIIIIIIIIIIIYYLILRKLPIVCSNAPYNILNDVIDMITLIY